MLRKAYPNKKDEHRTHRGQESPWFAKGRPPGDIESSQREDCPGLMSHRNCRWTNFVEDVDILSRVLWLHHGHSVGE